MFISLVLSSRRSSLGGERLDDDSVFYLYPCIPAMWFGVVRSLDDIGAVLFRFIHPAWVVGFVFHASFDGGDELLLAFVVWVYVAHGCIRLYAGIMP